MHLCFKYMLITRGKIMDNEASSDEPGFKNINEIRIKIGPIEVEYKGREEFLKNELEGLLLTVLNTYNEARIPFGIEESTTSSESSNEEKAKSAFSYTTGTIASKMGVNSGPDLIIAACAHLTLVEGKESFGRKEIIEEMKTATHYLKQGYISNLSARLGNLVRSGKISEISKDRYALTAQTRNEMEQILAN